MQKKQMTAFFLLTVTVASVLTSCRVSTAAKEHIYEDFDLKKDLGIEFPTKAFNIDEITIFDTEVLPAEPNFIGENITAFPMIVYDKMDIYESKTSKYPSNTLKNGEEIFLSEPVGDDIWGTVYSRDGKLIGYAKDGFLSAVSDGVGMYAEIGNEYGLAKTNSGDMINAYSHLVDVNKYLKVYYSDDLANTDVTTLDGVDLTEYDLVVSMKLSTQETSIGKPFYNRNMCLLQYDTLLKLVRAIRAFKNDGYTVVIYDAYRPTSVQQKWFDVVRVHKWVANPAIGMGGIHDRGTAVDISLLDASGMEIEMPTPMHTFTVDSARDSEKMTEAARANMEYMTKIMWNCGFTYINSEWWHFQCVNTKKYLPTDHPLDDIILVPSEFSSIN